MTNILETLSSEHKLCTGCGACRNICPVDAITMCADREGFMHPKVESERCVDCGLCEKNCPVLHPKYANLKKPECYAMMAADEERWTSASGGFVPLVARWILKKGGVVYGAAWDQEWNVCHIEIEDEAELYKIKGSKYLQGSVGKTYRSAKKKLQDGKWVLFTGLPCQIAGLYSVLGKMNTEKLVTIDILCHGAPSHKVFRKYIEENYDLETLERFEFRDKSVFGWSSTINCYFTDGKETHITGQEDSYYRAFLPCMIMRPSCGQCAFSRLPRQGDLTAGDFWGVERTEPKWNDKKGTSAILVNNKKGKKVLNALSSQMKLLEPVSMEAITHINKTVEQPFKSHSGRKHFFSSMDIKLFNELVECALSHKYDIGIAGLWYGINYGSILTYYALYNVVRSLGYDAVMLPKPNSLWEERFNSPDTIAQKFIWKHCNVFLPYPTQNDYYFANDSCRDFLLGSDVIWNYEICGRQSDMFFFLDWVENGHKKIAYAASFGNGTWGPEAYEQSASYYLKKFDAISIREREMIEPAREKIGRNDIVNVLDPVFLCPVQLYDEVIQDIKRENRTPFVFAYILRHGHPEDNKRLLELVRKLCHLEAFICANPNEYDKMKKAYGEDVLPVLSVEEWIYFMKNAAFYLGDSYHGLCFSLIFHKQFIIVYRPAKVNASNERFKSLLRIVGLEERLLEDETVDLQKAAELIQKPIDWEAVDERLDQARTFSYQWLKNALEEQTGNRYTVEEIIKDKENRKLFQMYNELHKKNSMLFKELEEIKQQITEMRAEHRFRKR
ncbi:MAG: Coenzyme F420 hydrogenase/dehydrogenase, beta subunit C-terminal domain [Eubacterium sp.]|nr:Coenzyme F420 hydrogenase/dehydrogenase, beta subunit C-terminal domain [Eubacterium sp.]